MFDASRHSGRFIRLFARTSDALIEGRPGSWEADLVDRLVKGTVGYDEQYLPAPGGKLTDSQVRDIRWRYDPLYGMTQQKLAEEYGIGESTVSDIINGRTWGWLK